MNPVTVQIYTDAGMNDRGSAWGAVIIRPGVEPAEASGMLKEKAESSTHAELRAAANAIHAALRDGLIKPGDRIVVRCDNQTAVRRLKGERFKTGRSRRRRDFDDVLDWIVETAIERGFEVTAKWVKGHQPLTSLDPHAPHNRRADRLCSRVLETRKVLKSRKRPHRREREQARARRTVEATG